MRSVSIAVAAILSTLYASAAYPQQHAHPQAAEKLGTVHFPTSCSPAVALKFDRAVTLLHSFEFGASIRAFNEVLAADSTCAMAHWGIAVSRWTNPMTAGNRAVPLLRQGKEAADAAMRLAARASERERGYIQAVGRLYDDFERKDQRTRIVEYERAMGELVARHPSDTEAKIFYALSLAASAPPTDKAYANQLKAGSILEPLWVKQPDHPGIAHYIIHTYDYPALADKARAAAQRYAGIAPSAAHALHMPSHTFTRVGMWEESVATNERSRNAALSTGSIAEALHAADYAMYAFLQLGKEPEAKAILDGLPVLAAKFDLTAITGAAPASAGVFALAAIPARWALERSAWTEAAALEPKASDYPYTEAMTYFARSLGASRTGELAKAKSSIDSLASIQQRLSAKGEAYWAEQVAIQHLAAQAWLDLAEKRETEALARMREAAAREDATEKSAVTPGPLAPARELLGDMLMELNRPAEASTEYRATLQKEPNRRHALRRLSSQRSTPLAFTGVSVIPMDGERVLANQTVVVENGRITYVGGPRQVAAGTTVIDGRGKFLMPGIAEFHAHVPSGGQAAHAHRALTLYALAGVMTARGMLGAPMHLALRDSIAAGQILGPRLLTSGPSFNNNSVTSPEIAMVMVRDQKAAGYDLLKIHPGVPRVAFDSLAATANRLGIPFSGHVPLAVGLDAAIAAKFSTIDHLDGLIEAMYSGAAPLTPQLNGFFGLGIVRQLDMSRFQRIVDRVRASGVAMVPTQILTDNYANDATGDELTSVPEMRYWVPQHVAAWRASKNNLLSQSSIPREQRMEYIALRRRFIKALHDAGVPFLLGSDAPQLWNVPGFSAHHELSALVAAGLTPYQALRTGTVNVAKFMNEEGRSGVVRNGARADLILLDANPLGDIANSRRISGVVVNGRWIGSAEREQMLGRLAAQ